MLHEYIHASMKIDQQEEQLNVDKSHVRDL